MTPKEIEEMKKDLMQTVEGLGNYVKHLEKMGKSLKKVNTEGMTEEKAKELERLANEELPEKLKEMNISLNRATEKYGKIIK